MRELTIVGRPGLLDSVPTPTGLFELGRDDAGEAPAAFEGEGFTMHEADATTEGEAR